MLYRDISKVLGIFFFCLAAAFILPLGLSIYYQYFLPVEEHLQPHSTVAFALSFLICLAIALLFYWIGKNASGNLFRREGIVAVVAIWFLSPAIAGLPFLLSGTLDNPFHAYFEATSGLTTTGATCMQGKEFDPVTKQEIPIQTVFCGVIQSNYVYYGNIEPVVDLQTGEVLHSGIEAVGKSLLFWRSLLQWVGGGGIILLFISILPALGVGGKVLFQAEQTGPVKGSLTPRLKETAAYLWKIYFFLTLFQIVMLMLTNEEMSLFDATTISFATLSTGGFSVHNENIGFYNNSWTEWVVIVFMIAGSINFSLYFYMLRGKFFRIYDLEFLLFICLIIAFCCLGVPLLVGTPNYQFGNVEGIFSIGDGFRVGVFQIISSMTSTGFFVANYDLWPFALQAILLIVQYVGGMSGSTAGGMKVVRLYMLFRIAQYKIENLFRPETVRSFRIGDRTIDNSAAILVLCFFLTVISVSVLGSFIYVYLGIGPESAVGLVACMVNNTGVSFRAAGPAESCGFLTNFEMMFSSVLMILGRLEYFAVLAILVPAFWKQK